MRYTFAQSLYEAMEKDNRIWFVTADLGFGIFDTIHSKFPDRFLNTGASEQAASDICVGLALGGKIPFMYTITPFFYRCFETIRTYINHESINVKLIGSGRDGDYSDHGDGFSHDASDIPSFMVNFENIESFYPQQKEDIPIVLSTMLQSNKPNFLSLRR